MKYVYPAVFTPAEEGGYLVDFPDIPGCFTDGDDMADAIYYAEDVLPLMLLDYEDDNKPVPTPTPINELTVPDGGFTSMILADTLEYRKAISKKSVKKTLSIPQWLDTIATKRNVNFSNVLQNALIKDLGLSV